jgi:cyclophilin family peptidyl-prolyl cis-trans isomerase
MHGGNRVFPYSRAILAGLVGVALAVAPGCGSGTKSVESPTASIADGAKSPTAHRRPSRPPVDLHPKVMLQTSMGDVLLRLDAEKAPQTVQNFLVYLDEGHYDQTILHQVVKGTLIVGGTYDANQVERKNHPPILNEAHNGLKNRRGTIAMARRPDAVDSATSQFFINLGNNEWLDHKQRTLAGYGYCVFGEVASGMEVLEQIAQVEVRKSGDLENVPFQKVLVKSARRVP